MRGISSIILRRLIVRRQISNLSSHNLIKTLILPSFTNSAVPKLSLSPYHTSACSSQLQKLPSLQFYRTMCSSPDGRSNIAVIKSAEEFNSSLSKVKDESLPALFYFTAVWCGPCRFISPVVEELSAKYPHVSTYKIDIDQEGLQNPLSKLSITAVPTLLFFQHGEKVAEVVGADVSRLNATMEELFKKD